MNKPALAFALLVSLSAAVAPAQAQCLNPPATQERPSAAAEDASSAGGAGALDRIVAIVDEDVVLASELDRAVNQIRAHFGFEGTPVRIQVRRRAKSLPGGRSKRA